MQTEYFHITSNNNKTHVERRHAHRGPDDTQTHANTHTKLSESAWANTHTVDNSARFDRSAIATSPIVLVRTLSHTTVFLRERPHAASLSWRCRAGVRLAGRASSSVCVLPLSAQFVVQIGQLLQESVVRPDVATHAHRPNGVHGAHLLDDHEVGDSARGRPRDAHHAVDEHFAWEVD